MDDVTTTIFTTRLTEAKALERIFKVAQRFDEAHMDLACHAAFPLILTPDLLYRIWASFLPQIPWTTVPDLLLSPLCHETIYETYEMDSSVRNILINELRDDPRFGISRLNDLAQFLQEYIGLTSSNDPDQQEIVETQRLAAVANIEPDYAAREIASKISNISQLSSAELFRVTTLIESLSPQLQEHAPLVNYAYGIQRYIHGDNRVAISVLNNLFGQNLQIEISGISVQRPIEFIPPSSRPRASSKPREGFESVSRYCFISYSNVDGLDFARKLADELESGSPFYKMWIDKRDINPSLDWDDQLSKGIQNCKCLLFVMTKDSTAVGSMNKNEWTMALKYKKPVVLIRLHKDADQPFGLGNRQWIDFSDNFEHGLAKLRKFLREIDSPKGVLSAMQDRLADAERALRRAKGDEEKRIQADIDELKKQIEVQQKVVDNPKAAEEQTQRNIEAGLERERKPEKPIASAQSTKFVNPPPGIAPTYFQDRLMETEQAVLFLKNEAQRVLTVVGRGGSGKTAMVCRLLKFVENGGLPDDFERKHGRVDVDGIVYLSEAGSRKVNFANLFEDLCKLLPVASAEKLSALYREPQISTEAKTMQLLAAFQGSKQIIVLLDNFQNVVDTEGWRVKDAELDEALRTILHAPHHPVKIIITTRVSARELDTFEPARQRLLPLDTGLQPEYAREAFVLMDEGNLVGIKNAGADLLNLAVTRTLGLPRALEALYAALRTDRFTTLQELLDQPILPENVVQAYVGEAFNRLDANGQKAMQALALYNRPVTPAAVDYMLEPFIPAIDSAPILQRLANMYFVRKESGRFYLHPVDREYAIGLIPVDSESNEKSIDRLSFTQRNLTLRGADYFAPARKPRAEWRRLDDLSAQLAEFDLRCAAGDYDGAASVLSEIDSEYLLLWGHYRLVIDLHERLQGKIENWKQNSLSTGILGLAYNQVGQIQRAIRLYEKALVMNREYRDRQGESICLGNLGQAYANLGNALKAIELHEQALAISREIGNKQNEGNLLGNLGSAYVALGETRQAIEYYEQALVIAREIGDRRGESIDLENISHTYLSLGDSQRAIENYQKAIQIADEISFSSVQQNARYGLADAFLFQNDLGNARATIEAALQYDVPQNNHNASALHGIIVLRQGDEVTAREAFLRAIGQADEILSKTAEYYSALDAKGLALCGLILAGRGDPSMPAGANTSKTVPPDKSTVSAGRVSPTVDDAIETFRKARKIAPHAGVVKSVLRLFDELVKCDTEGILKDVRSAVEGKE